MQIEIPKVMGNEEETGLMIGPVSGPMDEPYDMTDRLRWWVPDDLIGVCDTSRKIDIFTKNGFRIYNGNAAGASNPTNIERATPECTRPRQLASYIAASEQIIVEMVSKYIEGAAEDEGGGVSRPPAT